MASDSPSFICQKLKKKFRCLKTSHCSWSLRTSSAPVGAIALVGLQQFFNPFDFLGCLVRQQVEANPTVAVLGHASQCRNALAAEPHRDAFVADRLRVAQHIREFDKLALMRASPLRPEPAHDLDILARALTTTLERDAQSFELLRQPSDADAEG